MDKEAQAFELLPKSWQISRQGTETEEIRLRIGKRPTLTAGGKEIPFRDEPVTGEDIRRVLEKATGASLHASAATLREGYVNYRGIRIGVCGAYQRVCGERENLARVSSLVIRVPRERRGICREPAELLLRGPDRNLLLAGAPGAGKTTALRELIRLLSEGGFRVGVADERNELASWDTEGEGFDLGPCADVLTGLPKAEAAMMLLRGMNPQLIAMDEITREQDLDAVDQIAGCGVGILAGIHGQSLQELTKRGAYRRLLDRGIFRRILWIERRGRERSYRMEALGP